VHLALDLGKWGICAIDRERPRAPPEVHSLRY